MMGIKIAMGKGEKKEVEPLEDFEIFGEWFTVIKCPDCVGFVATHIKTGFKVSFVEESIKEAKESGIQRLLSYGKKYVLNKIKITPVINGGYMSHKPEEN